MNKIASHLILLVTLCGLAHFCQAALADGKSQYDRQCGECHGLTLKGTGHGPELVGPNFISKWGNRSIRDFHSLLSATMPAGDPG